MTRVVPIRGLDRIAALARAQRAAIAAERFLFLRHGETDGNLRSVYQRPDQPLNATGERQAEAAAAILAQERVGDVVASPMARAWRTASLAAEPHGVAPRPAADLAERLYTALFGQPNTGFDWAHDPPGCETLAGFVARVCGGLSQALAPPLPATGERLVVAHGGVLLVLTAVLELELPPEMHKNATPLRFERQGGSWTAQRLL